MVMRFKTLYFGVVLWDVQLVRSRKWKEFSGLKLRIHPNKIATNLNY